MLNDEVKILDCTLRDGGYINNWNFGIDSINGIVRGLVESKIDIIEVGFLDNISQKYNKNLTMFSEIKQIRPIIEEHKGNNFVAMIMVGKFDKNLITKRTEDDIKGIRVCFKKDQIENAMGYCKAVQDAGYDLYIQPASVMDYSFDEIELLIEKLKEFKISAYYIVDTYGLMGKRDVMNVFRHIDKLLDKKIPIGFHSHNNLQLSFSNTESILEIAGIRPVFVDACVNGMGRGAGNLCTELIIRYLNENVGREYGMLPILDLVDRYINPVFQTSPWGYSVAYYIAAVTSCHPDYASYLVNKQNLYIREINELIGRIEEKYKRNFNAEYIERLYLQYRKGKGSGDFENLKELFRDEVVLIAPGYSIKENVKEINSFIKSVDATVISINFVPTEIKKIDVVFFNNQKRFDMTSIGDLEGKNCQMICSDNIKSDLMRNKMHTVDQTDYVCKYNEISDTGGVIVLNMLEKMNVKKVYLAGFDGYTDRIRSYYNQKFVSGSERPNLNDKNKMMSMFIEDKRKDMNITSITDSMYFEENKP